MDSVTLGPGVIGQDTPLFQAWTEVARSRGTRPARLSRASVLGSGTC